MNNKTLRPGTNPSPPFPKPPPPPNPPVRGVVDEGTFARAWAAYEAAECEPFTNHLKTRLRAALQAAQPADVSTVPSVPEADEVDADAVMAIIDKWMINYDHIGTGSARSGQISEREWEEDRVKLLELLAATPAQVTTVASDQPEGEG